MGSETKFHLVAEHLFEKISIDAIVFFKKLLSF